MEKKANGTEYYRSTLAANPISNGAAAAMSMQRDARPASRASASDLSIINKTASITTGSKRPIRCSATAAGRSTSVCAADPVNFDARVVKSAQGALHCAIYFGCLLTAQRQLRCTSHSRRGPSACELRYSITRPFEARFLLVVKRKLTSTSVPRRWL